MAPAHPEDSSLQAGLGDVTHEDFPKGYGLQSWGGWRYLGVRCVQGHTLKGLREERFGVRFTPALAARVPCVRHATYLASIPSILEHGLLPGGGGGGGNARKRNQVHFAIVTLGDSRAKQGRQDAEVSIFMKKVEMADALPLVLTSTSAVVVSQGVDRTYFDKIVTHTEPPRALWDSAYVSREYLGVCNDEGTVIAPPKANKKPSYVFDVAPWDRTKHEGEVHLRARSAGLQLKPRSGSLVLRDNEGRLAIPRRRSESVDRASEPTAEREAETQRQERKYIQCAVCHKDLVAGTLECFFCRSLLTYAVANVATDVEMNNEDTKEEPEEGQDDQEEPQEEKRAKEETTVATKKEATKGKAPDDVVASLTPRPKGQPRRLQQQVPWKLSTSASG